MTVAAPAPTVRTVLGTPAVARLFATSLLARVPLAAAGIVVILRTQELTGSFAAGGAAAAVAALASGLGQPLLARLVDRGGQARVLLPGAAVAAAALAVFALLPAGTPLPLILATTLVAGAATPPLGAALRTLLPAVMGDPERLRAAYALEASALEVTYVVGPLVLAGAVAAWSTAAAAGHGLLGAMRNPGVQTLFALLALMGFTFGAVEVGVPAAADAAGHRGAAGPLLSLWGLGWMLGGLVAMRLQRPAGSVARLATALAALAAGHLALGAAGDLVVLGGLLLVAGLAIAPSFSAAFGLTDELAPPGALTEAFAWLSTAVAAGLAAGGALGGWAAEATGADAALLVAGLPGVVALAVVAARRATLLPTLQPA